MATDDVLTDDDVDAMLRDLLHDPPPPTGWEGRQRAVLSSYIESNGMPADERMPGHAPDGVVVLRERATTATAGTAGWQRRIVAGAAAVLVAVGAFATVRIARDQHVDPPAATESASTTPGTAAPTATPDGWPSLLPAITPLEGETVTASVSEISPEYPRTTTAVVARVDGSSVRDAVHIVAVDTAPYLAAMDQLGVYDVTEVIVDGVTVTRYEVEPNLAGGSPMAIVHSDDGHSVVVRGADPMGFLSLAGTTFASVSDDRAAGSLALRFDHLPPGYEVIAEPQAAMPGAMQPVLRLGRADGSLVADIGQAGPDWLHFLLDSDTVVRTEDGRYWRSDRETGSWLAWPVGEGRWIVLWIVFGPVDRPLARTEGSPATLEEALAIADRIELVDKDTWLARYPNAIDGGSSATTLAPEDLAEVTVATEAVPVATEEVPVVEADFSQTRVLVANASNIAGVAGILTTRLADDFQMLPAVNSGEPGPRERSVVYHHQGSVEAAKVLAERIGGADVLPMPDELPIEGGNDALLAPDIVDGRGAIDVLVMVGNDHARELDDPNAP